ncbi:MAG: ferredoxin, partial [Thermoguttaceae bacterium]|nr:ferredoxin [Thermoguttaceae bacterium]
LSSVDPVALDQACVELVYSSDDPGKKSLIARMEDRRAIHTLEAAEALGLGSRKYKLQTLF